jgi:hypothetical protein
MVNFTDASIDESSGLAMSVAFADLFYTCNDENGPIYAVQPSTGNTVGTATLAHTLVDPEAVSVDRNGGLWLADIGDNSSNRSSVAVYLIAAEPGPGTHSPSSSQYVLTYPDGPRNAEAFVAYLPGDQRIITKDNPSRVYQLPSSLVAGGTANGLTHVGTLTVGAVADAAITPDGRFLLLRCEGSNTTVYVHDAVSYAALGTIDVPSQTKPEGITVAVDQLSFWISSEGVNAPLYNVALPAEYQPAASTAPVSPCTGSEEVAPDAPWEMFDLTPWKLTLPIGSSGKPTEIKQPTLNTFRDPNYFYVNGTNDGVVFRAPVDGVTTSNSGYPRTELREMVPGGSEISWSPSSGTHTMTIVQRVMELPSGKNHLVCGQVHGGDDDVCVFRVEGSSLYATDGDDPHGTLITSSFALNTEFTVQFIASGGSIQMKYNGSTVATRSHSSSGCYFKAGCYNQANKSSGSGWGEVQIHELTVSHT